MLSQAPTAVTPLFVHEVGECWALGTERETEGHTHTLHTWLCLSMAKVVVNHTVLVLARGEAGVRGEPS